MPKLSILLSLIGLVTIYCQLTTPSQARTTPEDIVNEQIAGYESRIQSYTPQTKQKLTDWNKKITTFNEQKSASLEQICMTQGELLDEFIRRSEINEKLKTDGKTRNLADPIENARYWITFAHEAAAYQKAHVYVFNPTGETNVDRDILSTINQMQGDLNILRNKVQKSQTLVENLINSNDL